VAAVFDYERFAAKAPNVGQRFDQHFGSIVDGLFHALSNLSKKENQNSIGRAAQSIAWQRLLAQL